MELCHVSILLPLDIAGIVGAEGNTVPFASDFASASLTTLKLRLVLWEFLFLDQLFSPF